MTAREELHRLVDEIPEAELTEARGLLEELRSGSTNEDALTPEDLAEIDAGRQAVRRGEYITLDEYKRQRGL